MKRTFGYLTIIAALLALLAPGAGAGMEPRAGLARADAPQPETAPTVVSYQGRVTVDGVPYSGAGYFKFAIVNFWGDVSYWSNDGTSIGGGEPANPVPLSVSGGLFNVLLGDTSFPGMLEPLVAEVFSADGRYLRVWFATAPGGPYTLLTPDRRIGAAPYALNAELLDGQDGSAFASASHDHWGQVWTGASGDGLTLVGGSVGLSAISRDMGVYGEATSTMTGTHRGVVGIASTTSGPDYGVFGASDDTGVYGSGTAYGVYGYASATSGSNYGVYGQSDSTEGYGVYGTGPGYGVYGRADAPTPGPRYGVYGSASGTGGTNYGVYAIASGGGTNYGVYATSENYGVYGQAISTDTFSHFGVYGNASNTAGTDYGVFGTSDDTGVYGSGTAYGVYGYASATSGSNYGVYGQSDSTNGYGVSGVGYTGVYGRDDATLGRGVFGYASATSGPTYGVYGQSASTSGTGVFGWASATSGGNNGVSGQSDSTEYGTGVEGHATATSGTTYGVYGQSDSPYGYGVFGYASATSGYAGGVRGLSRAPQGSGVVGYATATSGVNYGVVGWSDSPNGFGVFFYGGLSGFGQKAAIVETRDYGWRHLYAMESPNNWFEDFGQAQLVDGQATVTIEPIFAQTVNLTRPYHVFLTPLGDCALYVADKTPTSFSVRALGGQACNVAFDYRIIARRLGYEDLRLKPGPDPASIAAAIQGIPATPGIKEGAGHETPNGR